MLNVLRGNRPDITPAQVVAVLIAGVPIVSNLLHVFGVYALSGDQEQALKDTLTWGGILAGLLIFGDAGLRATRNRSDAHVQAAAIQSAPEAPGPAHASPGEDLPDADLVVEEMPFDALPSDEEELSAPPPGDVAVPANGDLPADLELPTDAEEEAAPPPDDLDILDEVGADEPSAVQPSQAALT